MTRNLKPTQEVLPPEAQSPALPANPWGLFFYTLINAAGPISQSWAIGKAAASAAKQAEFSAKEAESAVRKAEIESEQQKTRFAHELAVLDRQMELERLRQAKPVAAKPKPAPRERKPTVRKSRVGT